MTNTVKMKASLGPFHVRNRPGDIKIVSSNGELIARVYEWQDNAMANARLLGASAKLLNTCKLAIDAIRDCPGPIDPSIEDLLQEVIDEVEPKEESKCPSS